MEEIILLHSSHTLPTNLRPDGPDPYIKLCYNLGLISVLKGLDIRQACAKIGPRTQLDKILNNKKMGIMKWNLTLRCDLSEIR